jgi:glutathione S-transferase
MIEVLGRRNSLNVQKVMWTLGELDLEYERHDVGGSFGYPDDYPNPNRVVPTIRDGDITVWESSACVRHLARSYGVGSLWPSDPKTLALADQWMEWQRSDISAVFFTMFMRKVRVPPEDVDDAWIEQAAAQCGKIFALLDEHLANQPFVASSELTMGDIPLGAMMYRYFELDIPRPELPHMSAWYARLCERPGYQKHVMIPFGTNLSEWNALETATTGVQ